MHLPRRDIIATGLVIAAVVLYMLWDAGSALPAMSGTRVTGVVVLVLGFAASATAVVPTFDQLLHGNKAYLAVTALIGLVAIIGGAQTLVTANDAGLVVMIAMVGLWLIATIHHSLLTTNTSPTAASHTWRPAKHGTAADCNSLRGEPAP